MTESTLRRPGDVGPRTTPTLQIPAAPVHSRLLLAGGPAAVALVFVAEVVTGSTPGIAARPAEVATYWAQDKLVVAAFLFVAAAIALAAFGAGLNGLLRERGDHGPLPVAVSLGGGIAAIGLTLWAMLAVTLGDASGKVGGEVMQVLNVLYQDGWVPIEVGFGLLLLATGLSARRTQALPAPVAWIAIVLGAVSVLPYVGAATLLGGTLWIAGIGALLAARGVSTRRRAEG